MKKRIIIILLLLVFGAAGGFFFFRKIQAKSSNFKIETVRLGEIKVTVSASGEIKAEKDVALKFQSSGLLSWVGVKKGDTVKKGQAIASLDKRDLEKKFKKEMNDYLNERWDFEQTQDDYKEEKERKLVTDEIKRILEKAQYDLNNAVLDAEIADLAVKLSTIYSPIDGLVVSLDEPYPLVNITPATATFRIVDPKTLYFEAKVDETEIAKIKVGDKVRLVLDAFSEDFGGTVGKIDFDSTTTGGGGTAYNLWIFFDRSDERFRLGMNGDAEIVRETVFDTLLVPLSSLSERNGQIFVWKVEDDRVKKVEVQLAKTNDKFAGITSGLSENDKIVTSNISLLKEGMTVKQR